MSEGDTTVRPATRADLAGIERLLRSHDLPTAGVADWIERFWIAEHGGRAVGVAGLEQYGSEALLRSVAVDEQWRGTGLGRRLVEVALLAARAANARGVYLLTTSAERYFPKLGFQRISREDVPESLHASVEFSGACPASAVAMRKIIAEA
jgi:amino-acid N-acetyltransferase